MRCRRESKECFFSATRRKRKNEDDVDDIQDEYIIRNGRKRHYLDDTPPVPAEEDRKPFNPVPLTPGGSAGRNHPLRSTDPLHDHVTDDVRRSSYTESIEDSNAQMENLEAQNVMRKGVYGPHDALDLLYKAATDRYLSLSPIVLSFVEVAYDPSSPHSLQIRQEPAPATTITSVTIQPSLASIPNRKTPLAQASTFGDRPQIQATNKSADPIDPRLLPSITLGEKAEIEARLSVEHEPGYQEALQAWARFRFVRAGWFTKEEAIKYIV
jgi:hypothetical protein